MSIKLTDVVRRFNGEEDVVAWLERLELVCKLQGVGSDMALIIPLFLEGPAYDVYAQMEEEKRQDAAKLKESLKVAFGMSPALAYAKFKARILLEGESPDAFLAELRRLGRTICSSVENDAVDEFVVCQFVDGLPEPTRSQLRALKSGVEWKVASVLQCAKSMLQQRDADRAGGLIGRELKGEGVEAASGAVREKKVRSDKEGSQRDVPKCVGCGKWGHVESECRQRAEKRRCYICNQVGHLKRDCTARGQGNGGRGAV